MFDLENSKFFCVEAAIHANHDSAKNTDFTGCSFELFSLSKPSTLLYVKNVNWNILQRGKM